MYCNDNRALQLSYKHKMYNIKAACRSSISELEETPSIFLDILSIFKCLKCVTKTYVERESLEYLKRFTRHGWLDEIIYVLKHLRKNE